MPAVAAVRKLPHLSGFERMIVLLDKRAGLRMVLGIGSSTT